jgi:hypothetical protein
LIACFAGYSWLLYSLFNQQADSSTIEVCLIKRATNVPCPSCGTTRSVLSLINGDPLQSLYTNPFGILIAGFMLIIPIWILIDYVKNEKTLLNYYTRTINLLNKLFIAIPMMILVLLNWIWNITKGL